MFLKLFDACGPCPSVFPFLIRESCSHIPLLAVLMGHPGQSMTLWQLQKIKQSDWQLENSSTATAE